MANKQRDDRRGYDSELSLEKSYLQNFNIFDNVLICIYLSIYIYIKEHIVKRYKYT